MFRLICSLVLSTCLLSSAAWSQTVVFSFGSPPSTLQSSLQSSVDAIRFNVTVNGIAGGARLRTTSGVVDCSVPPSRASKLVFVEEWQSDMPAIRWFRSSR